MRIAGVAIFSIIALLGLLGLFGIQIFGKDQLIAPIAGELVIGFAMLGLLRYFPQNKGQLSPQFAAFATMLAVPLTIFAIFLAEKSLLMFTGVEIIGKDGYIAILPFMLVTILAFIYDCFMGKMDVESYPALTNTICVLFFILLPVIFLATGNLLIAALAVLLNGLFFGGIFRKIKTEYFPGLQVNEYLIGFPISIVFAVEWSLVLTGSFDPVYNFIFWSAAIITVNESIIW